MRFLTHPVVSSLLMTVGMLGHHRRAPHARLRRARARSGIGSLALFFWGHWLVQLAGWEELLLVGAGVVLLALEIFVIPGLRDRRGRSGIVALLGGLVLSLVGAGATWAVILTAVGRVVVSLAAGASRRRWSLLRFLPRLPFGRRLVLETELTARRGLCLARRRRDRALARQARHGGVAAAAGRASPTSTASGSMSSPTASSSMPGSPIEVSAWTAIASSCGDSRNNERSEP